MFPKQLIVFKHAWWMAPINICHIFLFDTNDVIKDLAAGLKELKNNSFAHSCKHYFKRQHCKTLWTSVKRAAYILTHPALEFIYMHLFARWRTTIWLCCLNNLRLHKKYRA